MFTENRVIFDIEVESNENPEVPIGNTNTNDLFSLWYTLAMDTNSEDDASEAILTTEEAEAGEPEVITVNSRLNLGSADSVTDRSLYNSTMRENYHFENLSADMPIKITATNVFIRDGNLNKLEGNPTISKSDDQYILTGRFVRGNLTANGVVEPFAEYKDANGKIVGYSAVRFMESVSDDEEDTEGELEVETSADTDVEVADQATQSEAEDQESVSETIQEDLPRDTGEMLRVSNAIKDSSLGIDRAIGIFGEEKVFDLLRNTVDSEFVQWLIDNSNRNIYDSQIAQNRLLNEEQINMLIDRNDNFVMTQTKRNILRSLFDHRNVSDQQKVSIFAILAADNDFRRYAIETQHPEAAMVVKYFRSITDLWIKDKFIEYSNCPKSILARYFVDRMTFGVMTATEYNNLARLLLAHPNSDAGIYRAVANVNKVDIGIRNEAARRLI